MRQSFYNRCKRTVAELGAADALWYSLHRLFASLSPRCSLYKYYFVAQPVPPGPLLPAHRGRAVNVRPVEPGDEVLRHFPPPPAVIRARYGQGALCLAAFREQKLLGYAWVIHGPYEEDEVRSRFVPLPAGGSAWDFDVYLDPSERLTPAFARLWDEINAHFRRRGVTWTMSRISAFNPASIAAHRRLGGHIVGRALYVVFGRWQLTLATVRPYIHLSSGAGQVPVFHIRPPRAARTEARG